MIDNSFLFYTVSTLLIIFTLTSLLSKNAIYSILSAMLAFFSGALLFYILGSEYNAIIQASIYGFAIPVILGISVMFVKSEKTKSNKNFIIPYLTIISAGIFILALIYLTMMSSLTNSDIFNLAEQNSFSFYDVMQGFKQGLFVNHILSFEMISLLLTITITGFTMFKKEKY